MLLITHQNQLDQLPASDLKTHAQARFQQLAVDTDVPPNIILAEATDDITGPDYAFNGSSGMPTCLLLEVD